MSAHDPNANRAGYKETQVGWIPEEWECHKFGDIVESSEYGLSLKNSADGNFPIAGMKHVSDGRVILKDCPSVAMERVDAERYFLQCNDLLFNRTNSLEHVGKLGIVRFDTEIVFASYLIRLRIKNSGCPKFISDFFNMIDTRNRLKKLATPGVAQYNINATELKNQICVPLPPLPEQKKIAEILSTCDGVIEKTGALIEAKKRQKRALMQQLLTGRKRLPGFAGEWVVRKLSSVLTHVFRPVEWAPDKIFHLVSIRRRSMGLFRREPLRGVDYKTTDLHELKAGDFVISKRQVTHGALAMVTENFDGCHVSKEYSIFVNRDPGSFHMPYFDWLSRTQYLWWLAYVASNGVVIEKLIFEPKTFLRFEVLLPPSIEEQIAIADLLDTCNREIRTLESKLNTLKQQKRALMQKLLTGQIRVKV